MVLAAYTWNRKQSHTSAGEGERVIQLSSELKLVTLGRIRVCACVCPHVGMVNTDSPRIVRGMSLVIAVPFRCEHVQMSGWAVCFLWLSGNVAGSVQIDRSLV